jgi:hypothetical protein
MKVNELLYAQEKSEEARGRSQAPEGRRRGRWNRYARRLQRIRSDLPQL